MDPLHLENARAFGLNRRQVLFRIVLPLASPTMLAGIKTATIVSIGTATLAALVGAGGYGAPIVSGLSLNDVPTILTGAIPAALMALVAHMLVRAAGLGADSGRTAQAPVGRAAGRAVALSGPASMTDSSAPSSASLEVLSDT